MGTPALSQPTSDRYPRVASLIHTILVLVVLAGWSLLAKISTGRLSAASKPNRLHLYLTAIFLEWFVFAIVVAGVRWSGASVLLVVGERWRSARQVLRDIAIALGFWIVASALLWLFSKLLRVPDMAHNMQLMFPRGVAEIATWIALSVTAGICEETIFRGYLQRQFMFLTKSAPAGIIISAVAFGAAHAYQGSRFVILISLFGVMFGILAYWRGSVRPGMIAHAWQDSLGGVLAGLTRH